MPWAGIVDVIHDDNETVIDSLGPGAWFGEIALLQVSPPPSAIQKCEAVPRRARI